MSFFWIYCGVVFLCCNSQIDVVLAGKKQLGPKDIFKWLETSYKDGTGESWDDFKNPERRIRTEIVGESWFITPVLGKSNISYLNISAKPFECGGNSTCSLIIYGNTKTLGVLPLSDDKDRRKYISDSFEMISKINFTLNNRTSNISDVITKSYQRLAIFTENTSKQQSWAIYSIELYYYFCETSMTTNKVVLKQTNSSTTDVNVQAKCPNNAVTKDGKMNISVNCSVKGTWIFGNNESCSCGKGFGLDNWKCSPCENDYYKAEISNTQCSKCPPGKTNNATRTTCRCKDNHYIGEDNTVNGSCYEAVPPGSAPAVTSLTSTPEKAFLGKTVVIICEALAVPVPSYIIIQNDTAVVSTKKTYIIPVMDYTHAGSYKCIAKNILGSSSKNFSLSVLDLVQKTTMAIENCVGNVWHIVVSLLFGILVGVLLVYIIQYSRRRCRNSKLESNPEPPTTINVDSIYQDLDLNRMNEEENYESLRSVNCDSNDPSVKNESDYTDLKLDRVVEDNYQSLTKM